MKFKLKCITFLVLIFNLSYAQTRSCATNELHQLKLNQSTTYSTKYNFQLKQIIALEQSQAVQSIDTFITIPVVVHIIYSKIDPSQNISEQQIQSQIDILNEDYSALNVTSLDVPNVWSGLVTDSKIRFKLANKNPQGNFTTGIERRETNITDGFNILDNRIHSYPLGGMDAWDATKYLNIWVCSLKNNVLGFASFPGTGVNNDGVVISHKAFGRNGTAAKPYHLGRTTTHEVGHWLNLTHIWGDDNGACTGDDQINDTPLQSNSSTRCANFPKTDACTAVSPGIMFMNYMDYTDDKCMMFFTPGQITRMRNTLNTVRNSLKLSDGCAYNLPIYNIKIDSILSPVKSVSNNCFVPKIRVVNMNSIEIDSITFQYQNYLGYSKKYFYKGAIPANGNITIEFPEMSGTGTNDVFEVTAIGKDSSTIDNYATSSYRIIVGYNNNCIAGGTIIYPNPIGQSNTICIKTKFATEDKVTISLFNGLGQLLKEFETQLNPGDIVPMQFNDLESGVYFVRIEGEKFSSTTKFTRIKTESEMNKIEVCN